MDTNRLEGILAPYNPWWDTGDSARDWTTSLPSYRRPVVDEILSDLAELPQIVSLTGPRRVGKTTALTQIIEHLLRGQKVDPRRILYFSFDDPEVVATEENQCVVFDRLVERMQSPGEIGYLFLDEVQRLPRWELYLKKYYDLKTPLRFVVSGSASSPIFRSSQESLLGRIKDRHLLPFSFREYCHYHFHEQPAFSQLVGAHRELRPALLDGDGARSVECVVRLADALQPFKTEIDRAVTTYCLEGGFPEVWQLPTAVRKIEYLMEQQVRKVLYEDLMMLTKYRKPETVLRFFVYLLAHPGIEINMTKLAAEVGVERRVIEENLPRLEMTDLILRIQKFSHQPLRVRQGNIKCYPADMALRSAVLKTWQNVDPGTMGLYAENLVVRELTSWKEKIEVAYYRDKNREVDFVLTHGGNRYLPVEVKYRAQLGDLAGIRWFLEHYKLPLGVVITREHAASFVEGVAYLPLRYFLLAS